MNTGCGEGAVLALAISSSSIAALQIKHLCGRGCSVRHCLQCRWPQAVAIGSVATLRQMLQDCNNMSMNCSLVS